jgi:hypothetical protein
MGHAAEYAVKELGRLITSLALWFFELLTLAMSYGFGLTLYMVLESRSGGSKAGILRDLSAAPILFGVVVFACFMNFIQSGYILTSLIARTLCLRKFPRLYPLILPCLVVIHITILRLMDHGEWKLSINFPLFVGWGAATAFATALYSVRLQSSPKWGAKKRFWPWQAI